jgi:hypothetical protein
MTVPIIRVECCWVHRRDPFSAVRRPCPGVTRKPAISRQPVELGRRAPRTQAARNRLAFTQDWHNLLLTIEGARP